MQHIILDFIRRWKWIYAATVVLQGGMIAAGMAENSGLGLGVGAGFSFIMGILPLFADFGRGSAKVLKLLPLSRYQTTWTYWLLALGLPIIIQAIIWITASALYTVCLGRSLISLSQIGLLLWLSLAWLGFMYFLLYLQPLGPQHGFWNNVLGGIWAILWGGSVGSMMFLGQYFPNEWDKLKYWHWMFLWMGTLVALFSWFSSDEGLNRRAISRSISTPTRKPNFYKIRQPNALRGMNSFWWNMGWPALIFSAVLIMLVTGFHHFVADRPDVMDRSQFQENWKSLIYYGHILGIFLTLWLSLPWIQSLRAWRMLPMSSHGLSLTLFLSSIFPFLIFWLLASATGFYLHMHDEIAAWSKVLLILLGGLSLLAPLGLMTGFNVLMLIGVISLVGLGPVISEISQNSQLTWQLSGAIGGFLSSISYLACYWLITCRSEGYRPLKLFWTTRQ